jgi:SAM-dependent methyltransferase
MSFAEKVSAFNRSRKWNIFLSEFPPNSSTRLLDVGFNAIEYSSVDNYVEKHYPFPEQVTALGVDSPEAFSKRYPRVRAVRYDGNTFPFGDKDFDVCWSNAVIEHVGDEAKQLLFLQEIRRVAKRGFITTPNKMFPIEVHTRTPFLHWLPKSVFDKFLRMTGRKWAAGNYMHLLTSGKLERLLSRAGIEDYKIIRNRLFGFTLDFVVVF